MSGGQHSTPTAEQREVIMRRDASRLRAGARATAAERAGIRWLRPTELAAQLGSSTLGLGYRLGRRTGRAVRDRVGRLAPIRSFGRDASARDRSGLGL